MTGMKLEVDVIPVSDVDRSKGFYARVGWRLDDDVAPLDGLRIVQFTPPGSGTSVTFGQGLTTAAPGSAAGGPVFKDGRAYSQARQLRERYGFHGELRATGNILRDQFLFLLRAGFDALEVVKDADAAVFAQAVSRYSVFYQPAGDRRIPALRARLGRGQPAAVCERV